ncbi:MAG: hypothetical protein QG657_4676 [Acidobacteriota bacterium]|nr:hypothetical protein [Acidobacteriota bacterium]
MTLVFVLCCLMSISAWAARKVDFYSANAAGYIQKMNSQVDHGRSAMNSIFGLNQGEKFILTRQRTDFNSVTHSRYRQTYRGIPIWGIETIVSRDYTDEVVKINGAVILDTPRDILAIPGVLDPKSALKRMEKQHKSKDANAVWSFRNEEYGTYIYIDKKSKANLCYVVSFFADTETGNPSRPIFFVDVKSGQVLDSFDMLAYGDGTGPGGNTKVGQYEYGTDYPGFGVTINGSTYTMNTTDVKTVDLNHTTSGNTTAYSYTGPRNTHESVNGAYCPLNDAQYFGQVVFDTYLNWYSVPVLPFQLTLKCHYSTNFENAFWDGSSMTFGDGYSTFYPLVSLDVVSHEISHGFTQNHSNLIYSSQSGGINEAFSDMAGEAAEFYMKGVNDFKVGYDIYKNPTGALRYMYDPPLDYHSIDHVSEYYEGLDVHYSSGIYNKVFYLIATSSGWTTRMAFDIFVKANMDYWTPGTNFQQGAEGVISAVLDYGYNCQDVLNAFAVVGITVVCGPPEADFTASLVSGGIPLTTHFTDQSQAASTYSWDFGDGGTSTLQNPSHTYTTIGTFTVTLTVTNRFGSDIETKVNYINATAPQPPVAAFSASATNVYIGGTVTFTDESIENPTSWLWTFEGGTPATSTEQNPTVTYNTVGTFNVTLVASNAQGSDTEAKVDFINVDLLPYCNSLSRFQNNEWIAGVKIGSLDNSSGAAAYTDFTGITCNLTGGTLASVTLTPGYSNYNYREYWKIWIDYNHDHDFDDTGEEVFSGSDTVPINGFFTVATGINIVTRMRVSMKQGSYPTQCETFGGGEVEDYTVNISPGLPGVLKLTSPNGGENWQLGSGHPITWNPGGVSANLKITLWKNGAQVGIIANSIAPATGSYAWTVGKYSGGTAAVGTGYAIKIKEIGTTVSDISEAPFTITGLTVTSPNGGENWPTGSIHKITWNASGLSNSVKITLWKDGVLVGTILNNISPTAGSYSWTVGQYNGGTAPVGTGYTIKIKEIGTAVSDASNAAFSITN